MADMLLVKLRLPGNTVRAKFHTRKNGQAGHEVLLPETRGRQVAGKCSWYFNGLFVERIPCGWSLQNWTIENQRHVISSYAEIEPLTARMLLGEINCFSLGRIDNDQEYLDLLLKEYNENPNFVWDEIETEG
jgi:hypothetical protein